MTALKYLLLTPKTADSRVDVCTYYFLFIFKGDNYRIWLESNKLIKRRVSLPFVKMTWLGVAEGIDPP